MFFKTTCFSWLVQQNMGFMPAMLKIFVFFYRVHEKCQLPPNMERKRLLMFNFTFGLLSRVIRSCRESRVVVFFKKKKEKKYNILIVHLFLYQYITINASGKRAPCVIAINCIHDSPDYNYRKHHWTLHWTHWRELVIFRPKSRLCPQRPWWGRGQRYEQDKEGHTRSSPTALSCSICAKASH